MTYALEFLPEARDEAQEAILFYEERVQGLGLRLRRELEKTCRTLSQQPLLWRERNGGYRRVNLPGFPYYIAYFIRGERLLVAAIGHTSRHPDYWKERKI